MRGHWKVILLAVVLAVTVALLPATGETARGEFTLSVGTETAGNDPYTAALEHFKKEMEQATEGRILVNIYPKQQLGTEQSMMEGMRAGSVDAAIVGGPNFAAFVPEMGILSVSYLFKSPDHFKRAMALDSPVFKHLQGLVGEKKIGMRLIGLGTIGIRWYANRKGPVRSPEDITKLGLRTRVMGSPIEREVWTAFGAAPVTMPMPEVYTAGRQGVVDAAENGPSLLYTYKVYEVFPYVSKTEHQWLVAPLLISEKTWAKLPADLQAAVAKAGAEAGVVSIDASQKMTADAVEAMRKSGKATIVTDVDQDAFRRRVAHLYDRVAKELKAEELLRLVRSLEK
jgi:C4-dicarboxylate-binding protein DctP